MMSKNTTEVSHKNLPIYDYEFWSLLNQYKVAGRHSSFENLLKEVFGRFKLEDNGSLTYIGHSLENKEVKAEA